MQQPIVALVKDPTDGTHTVLEVSLVEGVADFIAELTAGSASNSHLQRWTQGLEKEIASAFVKDMNDTNVKKWLYNGPGTPERPGDLGYWVGYRIAMCYYNHTTDNKQAVQELVALDDPQAIFTHSGWPNGKGGVSC